MSFNGGAASFDSYAVLTLRIFGDSPGRLFGQLVHIGALRFDSRLILDLGSGAPPAGSRFSLLGFGFWQLQRRAAQAALNRRQPSVLSQRGNGCCRCPSRWAYCWQHSASW